MPLEPSVIASEARRSRATRTPPPAHTPALTFQNYLILLGAALLAYGFSLRHAADADNIAAWITSVVIYHYKGLDDLEVRSVMG